MTNISVRIAELGWCRVISDDSQINEIRKHVLRHGGRLTQLELGSLPLHFLDNKAKGGVLFVKAGDGSVTVIVDEIAKGVNALPEALVGHLLTELEYEANFAELLHPHGGQTLGLLGLAALADEAVLATDVGYPLSESVECLVVLSHVAVSMLAFELRQFGETGIP